MCGKIKDNLHFSSSVGCSKNWLSKAQYGNEFAVCKQRDRDN